MKPTSSTTSISILCPFYNEEDGIELFFQAMLPILYKLDLKYEIICVDDGSSDKTPELLSHYAEIYNNIKVITKLLMSIVSTMILTILRLSGLYNKLKATQYEY